LWRWLSSSLRRRVWHSNPNEWRNAQALEVLPNGLLRVNVPAETLDAAQPGLEDRVALPAETTITMTAMFQND